MPSRNRSNRKEEDLRPEYRFDYTKSRPNRFARRIGPDSVMVVLDPDVAEVFRDSKRLNALLRATIAAMDKRRTRRSGRSTGSRKRG